MTGWPIGVLQVDPPLRIWAALPRQFPDAHATPAGLERMALAARDQTGSKVARSPGGLLHLLDPGRIHEPVDLYFLNFRSVLDVMLASAPGDDPDLRAFLWGDASRQHLTAVQLLRGVLTPAEQRFAGWDLSLHQRLHLLDAQKRALYQILAHLAAERGPEWPSAVPDWAVWCARLDASEWPWFDPQGDLPSLPSLPTALRDWLRAERLLAEDVDAGAVEWCCELRGRAT